MFMFKYSHHGCVVIFVKSGLEFCILKETRKKQVDLGHWADPLKFGVSARTYRNGPLIRGDILKKYGRAPPQRRPLHQVR